MSYIYRASPTFWKSYDDLPDDIKDAADEKFDYFSKDPYHPSLKTKKMGGMRGLVFEGHIKDDWVFVFRYIDLSDGGKAIESLLAGKHDETYARAKRMGF